MTRFHYELPKPNPSSGFDGLSQQAKEALAQTALNTSPAEQLLSGSNEASDLGIEKSSEAAGLFLDDMGICLRQAVQECGNNLPHSLAESPTLSELTLDKLANYALIPKDITNLYSSGQLESFLSNLSSDEQRAWGVVEGKLFNSLASQGYSDIEIDIPSTLSPYLLEFAYGYDPNLNPNQPTTLHVSGAIGGDAHFDNLTDASGLTSLKSIGKSAFFNNLTDASGLTSLENIGKSAFFNNLTDASGLTSLESIGDSACFNNLTDASGLTSLKSIGGSAHFNNLTDASGLTSLESIGAGAYFDNLTDSSGLTSLKSIGWDACFSKLTDSSGLTSLESIGNNANFKNLTDASGLTSLKSIGAGANFSKLTDSSGLTSLESIGRSAVFTNLTDSSGLTSLKSIGGDAYFDNLAKSQIANIPALS